MRSLVSAHGVAAGVAPQQVRPFIARVQPIAAPDGIPVSLLCCEYALQDYHDALFETYRIDCPDDVRRAVPKRRAEYLAGRCLARRLLLEKGVDTQIGSGHHRQPLWPRGAIGSISHTDRRAVCGVASTDRMQCLGIDIEHWFSSKVAESVSPRLVNDREIRVMARHWPWEQALTVAFSAKESVFKALYPFVGKYFDFDCAEIIHVNPASCVVTLRITKLLAPTIPASKIIGAYYRILPDGVLTVIGERLQVLAHR